MSLVFERGGPAAAHEGGAPVPGRRLVRRRAWGPLKRVFDVLGALLLLPTLALVALLLLILNPFLNPGSLLLRQERMGEGCRPFLAWKFRSMTAAPTVSRGPFDPLESDRITPLGGLLRRARLDELPQILNVLGGEMSLIGPRPDYLPHARVYVETVAGYRERCRVRPGISGLAQVTVGYVEGIEGLRSKVAADLVYARRVSLALDLWIAWRTVIVIFGRKGL